MYIPQGSLVFGNIWAIMRDPVLYQDPEVFEPRRWLARDAIVGVEERKDADVDGEEEEAGKDRDPRALVFGFGRRCEFDFGVALSQCWFH
jgi:cytochrome P450